MGGGGGMKPFNFNEDSRAQTRRAAEERSRIHRWQVPGSSRVVHQAHGAVVVPHASNLAAVMNAAEMWGCDWVTTPGRGGVGRRSFGAGGRNADTL